MTIPRDIITDLLPTYWSGEASPATRDAVEAAFAQDSAFAEEARRTLGALAALPLPTAARSESAHELSALRRARRVLRTQRILFALASTLTLNALSVGFSFEISGGHTRMHWLAIPGQAAIVGGVGVLAMVSWVLYARITRTVQTQVLGMEP
jgi:anti-sigma factor RsiW